MDTSSSSEDLSSSDCELDDDSSYEDVSDKFETSKICGATLQLPQGLCESKDIFKEFFSFKTWNSLSEINKQHLKNFLPCFPENDDQEKNVTLQKLFNREQFRFNSPLMHFQEKLRAGYFRPDIAKIRRVMKQEQRKECAFQQRVHLKKLVHEMMVSRHHLVDVANNLPPGIEPRMDDSQIANFQEVSPRAFRAKRRYFQELTAIKSQVEDSLDWSDDENYPEGPPVQLTKKQKRHLNGLQTSGNIPYISNSVERVVTSTLSKKSFGFDLENSITATYNPYQLNEDSYKALLIAHKKRKLDFDLNPELITKGLSLRDIAQRTQLIPSKKSTTSNGSKINYQSEHREKDHQSNRSKSSSKKKVIVRANESYTKPINNVSEVIKSCSYSEPEFSDSDSFVDPVMSPLLVAIKSKSPRSRTPKPKLQASVINSSKTKLAVPPLIEFENNHPPSVIPSEPILKLDEPSSLIPSVLENITPISQFSNRIMPATFSDLDGIDMMNLPVDLDDSNIDILDEINVKAELMQETHSNFLSLIRDIICSTLDHRMSLSNLEDRLKSWNENPISPLNDWYSTVDSWVNLLPSAIAFLTGETSDQPDEFVPYVEYKPLLQSYQWIGAGRDSDNHLSSLCQYWLDHRDEIIIPTNSHIQDLDVIDMTDKPQTPPPPRCPTQWTVRKAELDEVEQFREQERSRYSNPHKAFTYRMNGYESVVGPVKGMYNQNPSISKARGHSMLNADRPNFVTILTLVRDATARLPNGEGTRADICELLKSSQYISHSAPENVLQSVVSGALDRMHTEYDPCVKYDTKRKIWIYLHRNRSETDFERIHQQVQGMSKQLKKTSRKNKPKAKQEKSSNKQTVVHSETTSYSTIPTTTTISSTSAQVQSEKSSKSFKTPVCRVFNVPSTSSNTDSASVSTMCPKITASSGTSLLVSPLKHSPKSLPVQIQQSPEKLESPKIITTSSPLTSISQLEKPTKIVPSIIAPTKQDIEEAIQTLTPISKQVSSPKSTTKSLVKIINSAQGKSLITQTGSMTQTPTVFIKQVDQKTLTNKQIVTQPQISQQLLQSIASQQKIKVPQMVQINQQKQIIVTSQQLIKTINQKPVQSVAAQQLISTSIQPQTTVNQTNISQHLLQAINQQQHQQTVSANLTPTQHQQQQLLQSIKQKVQNQPTVLTLQQAVLKQQASIQQLQKQFQQQQVAKGTSLLGQQRIITQVGTSKTAVQNQAPLVAKVLTNAAGQVISVESLLAHQKQHGTLPQGTTLRVSGSKPGQTNLIQLSDSTANQIQQFAVVSQNNIVSIAGGQQRLTAVGTQSSSTSTPISVTTTKSITTNKPIAKQPQTAKFVPSKHLTHQLVNAKFITTQNVAGNKLIPQQKIVVNQGSQIKINTTTAKPVVTKTLSGNQSMTNTVRMVNTTGLNLTHIAGKPVLLAKGNTLQNIQGQNVILQAQTTLNTSTSNIVLPNNTRVIQNQSVIQNQGGNTAQVVLGTAQLNQLKVQSVNQNIVQANGNQIVLSSQNLKPQSNVSLTGQPTQNQTVVLGGTIKMQAGTQGNQRVVLASQGQAGQLVAQQILLPSGFQGGAINIKTLQGLKVIPLAQAQTQSKGRPQQVFARIMNPTSAARITQINNSQAPSNFSGKNPGNTD